MSGHFADTYYFLALVNTKDRGHKAAMRHSRGPVQRLVTTTWVLVEFADALSSIDSRASAARFIQRIKTEYSIEIVPPSVVQFERGLILYEQRADKGWSLTDCISFVVMGERGITDALTADHHFEQAGFRAVLRDDQD